jgi:outer membrane receptor protein involved in Fe transport
LSLRGTWTTAFRAPNLADLHEGENRSAILLLPDGTAPSMSARALIWAGRNASLKPESSRGWTLGFELGSEESAEWSVAATYFDIRLRNQFTELEIAPNLLADPVHADRITREPTQLDRTEVCGRSTFIGNPGDCLSAPIDVIVDARLRNSSILSTSGIDLSLQRALDTRAGRFKAELEGAYVIRYAVQETPTAPVVEKVDTQNNVLRLRLRSSLDWQPGRAGARVQLNHDGGYRDVQSEPHRPVGSWSTWDLRLYYDLPRHERGATTDSRIALNIQNVFDEDPPFLNNPLGIGYDAENADLMGRVLSLQLTTRW